MNDVHMNGKHIGLLVTTLVIISAIVFIVANKKQTSVTQEIQNPIPSSAEKVDTTVLTSSNFKAQYNVSDLPVYAKNVSGVRDLQFSPGGELLASQTSVGTVVAISNGVTKELLTGLNRTHGLAFHNNYLYVAEETQMTRYKWDESAITATNKEVLFTIPSGGRHFTRSIVFDKQNRMFVSIGSTCDVCVEKNPFLAAVITADENGKNVRLYSSGLRNSVFLAVNPTTDEVWGTDMGRDFLGDTTPADEVNIIKDGKNYGWPYCYNDKVRDTSFESGKTFDCAQTEAPLFKIPAHSAPLGLAFIDSGKFPADWQGDLLVAYHGSWNRTVPDGYKIVHMKVSGNTITNAEDFVTGFIQGSNVVARPVDMTFDKEGNLYISDDKVGVIYKLNL